MSCYRSAPPPPVAPPPPAPPALMTMELASVGPITSSTQGTLIALRAALAGFEVKPAHVVLGSTTHRLGYTVYKDGEKVLHVMPDASGAITAIVAVSSKVAVADRPWKVGAKLTSAKALTTCKCWEEEQVVCFPDGEHVAVAFNRECGWESYSTEEERQDLIGMPISRLVWSPSSYSEDSNPYGGDEYGGEYGSGY